MDWGRIFPWSYARRPLPGPGSENLAYLTQILNLQTAIGPGNANQRQIRSYGPLAYVPKSLPLQGIGGPISGQIYGTPLIQRR